jgi:hypothetical protein
MAGFQKWQALGCQLFKRELFNQKNIWQILKLASWLWPAFNSSWRSSERSVIQ